MPIPRIDYFDFLFSSGRGVRTDQVDWSIDDNDLDAKIRSLLGSSGITFGIVGDVLVISYPDGMGGTTTLRFVGGTQPIVFARRSARNAGVTFVAADFTSNTSTETATDIIAVGGGGADRYLAFWQPDDQLELTEIRSQNSAVNMIASFAGPVPIQVAGVHGYYWQSSAEISAVHLGGNWVLRSPGAIFPPFPRRIAVQPGTAVPTWTASDFMVGGDNTVSYTAIVGAVFLLERHYRALWVPDSARIS